MRTENTVIMNKLKENKPTAQFRQINEKNSKYLLLKRFADIVFSSIVILITTPIMVLLTLLIRLESKGPAFFLQERVGRDGKIFKVFKLRTMHMNTEDQGGGVITESNDPRITKIGKLIRGCSLDEFPQFLNVLKGEMSYVGPRPISLSEHLFVIKTLKEEKRKIPQGLVHRVKPGITGWALLHGREKISYEDRFRFNAEYENNISFIFDAKIFLLTFKKYLFTNLCVLGLFLGFAGFIAYKFWH